MVELRDRIAVVVERLKSSHYDVERLCARAFSDGAHEAATQLSEAGGHIDQAIEALGAAAG